MNDMSLNVADNLSAPSRESRALSLQARGVGTHAQEVLKPVSAVGLHGGGSVGIWFKGIGRYGVWVKGKG